MPHHDLIVIGAGPGGYVAAIRAAQLGKNVACIEKERLLGGTCLRVGCIPSKAMLESSALYEHAARGWKDRGIVPERVRLDLPALLKHKQKVVDTLGGGIDGLFKKHKITRYLGHASFDGPGQIVLDGGDSRQQLTAEHVIIATGSSVATLPGVEIDEDRIVSSTGALEFADVPKHLIVIGAGYIGLEMGTVWRRLGAEVTAQDLQEAGTQIPPRMPR
jgi:dihydrolipoamide dehydrogenase